MIQEKHKKIFFIGSSRDYHAYDWYRTIKEVCSESEVCFITDMVEGENYDKLIKEDDKVINLFNIDRFLFRKQSRHGNVWRNIIKLVLSPIQIFNIRKIRSSNPRAIFHAMPMYYMFLCAIAGIEYIGTPQGSEILVRPKKSILYKKFARIALSGAKYVTVDSISMQKEIAEAFNLDSTVIQNGIDIKKINQTIDKTDLRGSDRVLIVSFRGFTPLYRIDEIIAARGRSDEKQGISFIYPFEDRNYSNKIRSKFCQLDRDLGRLSRDDMYSLFARTKLAISIPFSDSSPRSVYEAIFCGSGVAVTYHGWYDLLPDCMKARIFLVDLKDAFWFEKAHRWAEEIKTIPYKPSVEAMEMFDQRRTMRKVSSMFYS